MNEERFINIETKIAFQDQTIQDLNDVLYEQQQQIEKLASICDLLMRQVKEIAALTPKSSAPANEQPPHY